VDIIEEIARLRGYDSFPDEIGPYRPGTVPNSPVHLLSRSLRALLGGRGLLEARPVPFVRGDDATHVKVVNPIAEDERHLRRSLFETLSRAAEYNLARMQRNIRLYEIGNVFAPDESTATKVTEHTAVAAVISGARMPTHFTNPARMDWDEWDAKGLAEDIAGRVWRSEVELRPAPDEHGRLWQLLVGGSEVGEVRRLPIDSPPWAAPAFGIEIRVASVSAEPIEPSQRHAVTAGSRAIVVPTPALAGFGTVTPPPTQPAADFDIALIVPDSIPAGKVEEAIRGASGELLESLVLFDHFRGGSGGAALPPGTRSLAWRLTFRHPERTLRDKEVEGRRQKVLAVLEKELGVRQRSS
jgi:phenylalanyl-tRNA synthetase beta chain